MIPRLLGRAVDQTQVAIAGGDAGAAAETALWSTALLLLGVSVLRGLFTMVQNYYGESVGHHIGYELRLAFYEKIQRLSFGFHDRVHSGDLITIGMLDLEGVRMFFSTGIVRMVLLTMLIGIGAYLLLSTDLRARPPRAQLRALRRLALVDDPPAAARHLARAAGAAVGPDPGDGGEPRRHPRRARLRRAGARAAEVRRRLAERARARPPAASASASPTPARCRFSFFAAMGLVLWFGGGKVAAGEISVGTLTSFLTFMTILQMPVRQLGLMVNSFSRASTCGARLFGFLDLDVEIADAPGARPLEVTDGTLRFEDVGFAYAGRRAGRRCATSASRPAAARPSASSARPAAASRRSRT